MITDEQAKRICYAIEHDFLTLEQACDIEGVNRTRFGHMASATKPERPAWAEWYRRAKSAAIKHWLGLIEVYAGENNNAGVKACQHVLMALDRERFRDDKGIGRNQVTVNIIQGADHAIELAEVEVVEGGVERKLIEEVEGGDS